MNKLILTGKNEDIIYLKEDTEVLINANTANHLTLIIESSITCNVIIESNSTSTINCVSNNNLDLNLELESNANIIWRNLIKATNQLTYKVNVHHKKNSSSHIILRGLTEDNGAIDYLINSIASNYATNANVHQDSKIIMLNNKPSTITPNLLIDVEEIDASHGATIGGFDEDSIFYLESRGIPGNLATKMLLSSFIYNDYFNETNLPVVKQYLTKGG